MPVYFGLLLDALLGDPKGLPHPVMLVGKIISAYEKLFYPRADKRTGGLLFMLAVLVTVAALVLAPFALLSRWPWAQTVFGVYLLYTALAWKSLKAEPGLAIKALQRGDLAAARQKLALVVGRDTQDLTPPQIVRAVVETVAENTVDGVLSPLFYMCLGYIFWGLPGAALLACLYKAVNTMDSMVGYRNARYYDFGFFPAHLDDAANLIPARLGALLMLMAGGLLGYDLVGGWRTWLKDRYAHKSPNSAQPESVMAGLLGIQLGGPNYYGGRLVTKPFIGRAKKAPDLDDYTRACRILDCSVLLAALIYGFFYLGKIVL